MFSKRIPVGSLLRDERNGDIYLTIKLEACENVGIIYYLCKLYDSINQQIDAPYTFFTILNNEHLQKFTLLNTSAIIKPDGTLVHVLETVDSSFINSLVSNEEFILRFLSLVNKFVINKNKVFNVIKINNKYKQVTLERKLCFIERFLYSADVLGITVSWEDLLGKFIPVIDDLDINEFKNVGLDKCLKCLTDHNKLILQNEK